MNDVERNVMKASRQAISLSTGAQVWPVVVLAMFTMVVATLGGSSRADVIQLAALRPLGGIFFAFSLYFISRQNFQEARVPAWILGFLALWMSIQLVPLPAFVWQALPGREIIAEFDRAVGQPDLWRPISITPARGLNALLSLIIPAAALTLALMIGAKSRMLLQIISIIGIVDALLGLMQVISGRGSPLYTYAITNEGSAVGLFANENHSAVFSAIVMLLIARLGSTSKVVREPVWLRLSHVPAFLLLLLAILATGSRAGMAMGLLGLVVSAFLFALSLEGNRKARRGTPKLQAWVMANPRALLGLFALTVFGLISVFFLLGQMPSIDSVVSQDPLEDLRWKLLPVMTDMVRAHWLLGSGFGSFDRLYMIYEPTELLMPAYVNQAHNDWVQLIIEGGIPAAVLLAWLLAWTAKVIWQTRVQGTLGFAQLLFWGALIAIIAGASIVDYPLRTPLFQMVGVWLLVALADEKADLQHAPSHSER